MPSTGITGLGTTVSGSLTGSLGSILGVNIGNIEVNDIDISNMASVNGWKEWIAGMKSQGELQMDMLYDGDDFDTLLGTGIGGTVETWTVTFPDGAVFVCDGYIKSLGSLKAPIDDKMTFSVNIKLTSEPTFTPGVPVPS